MNPVPAPQRNVDVSVIFVNWNTLELTSAAIRTLRERSRSVEIEIILVDNGSTRDNSVVELPLRFPDITFFANAHNLGFAGANNIGMRVARGRYVLLLNSDTLQTENAVGRSVEYMDQHTEVGALGILHRQLEPAGAIQPSSFSFPRPWSDIRGALGLDVDAAPTAYLTKAPPEQDVDWVVGSFLMIRRECLADTGHLDERFFLYDEDIDWCRRSRSAGWVIRFWPGASFVHLGNGSQHAMRDKTFSHHRARLTYLTNHHSSFLVALYYLTLVSRLSAGTVRQLLRVLTGHGQFSDVRQRVMRLWRLLRMAPGRQGS